MPETQRTTLIKGGFVYDHDGDTDRPVAADILIRGARIERVAAGLAEQVQGSERPDRVIDARERLVIPGFVNAHYHSHDVLFKGFFEPMPLYFWFVNALPPQYPKRSTEEVRARTLLGAAECLHAGITTIQDMLTISPFDDAHVDTVIKAYADIGIRTTLSLQIGDLKGLDRVPFWRELIPSEFHAYVGGAVEPSEGEGPVEWVARQYRRVPALPPRLRWALSPTSAIMSSPDLLSGIAALAGEHGLSIFTHIYETRAEALGSRMFLADHGGSQVKYMRSLGLLGPRLGFAHGVWMNQEEIDILAETGTNVILNPASNMKTKGGVAPIRRYLASGVGLGLGCDNCSCTDVQNMFQAMRLFSGLAAISDPEMGPPTAADAMRTATEGGAKVLGLEREIGAIKPGLKADLSLVDLATFSFVPFNSAARQLVFSETGSGVDTVLVDGEVVMERRRLQTIDEDELRQAVGVVMHGLKHDYAAVRARFENLHPYLLAAWRRAWQEDVGMQQYVGRHP
jgi:5-methylthioadenosine/S-adenosylhomocysteine deaminase